MITVKLFGLLRLDAGVKELSVEANTVKDLIPAVARAAQDRVSAKDLERCIVMVNGKPAKKQSKLQGGDQVTFLSPVAGG